VVVVLVLVFFEWQQPVVPLVNQLHIEPALPETELNWFFVWQVVPGLCLVVGWLRLLLVVQLFFSTAQLQVLNVQLHFQQK
jgi:hypothetical protein